MRTKKSISCVCQSILNDIGDVTCTFPDDIDWLLEIYGKGYKKYTLKISYSLSFHRIFNPYTITIEDMPSIAFTRYETKLIINKIKDNSNQRHVNVDAAIKQAELLRKQRAFPNCFE